MGSAHGKMGMLAMWRRPAPYLRRNVLAELNHQEGKRQSGSGCFRKPGTNAAKVLKSTTLRLAEDVVNIAPNF